jgi:hypothetical protein
MQGIPNFKREIQRATENKVKYADLQPAKPIPHKV